MNKGRSLVAMLFLSALATPVVRAEDVRSQIVAGQSMTLTAEVVSFDAATRKLTLKGPLGGTVEGTVSKDVADVSGLTPGSMVSATYYEAIAAGVRRKGEDSALVAAADVAAKAGAVVADDEKDSVSATMTVESVDVANNTVVFKDEDGTLIPTEVLRPEFQAKLKDLKPGDQVDLTYSAALVTAITPMKPGEEAKIAMKSGTLVIDKGEIVNRVNNNLTIKNEAGRLIRVTVDGDFKFQLNGKDATVYDLEKGMKLTRTALRVKDVAYSE